MTNMTPVSANNAIELAVRVGRIISDCMPGVTLTYTRDLDAKPGMDTGGVIADSGNYVINVAIMGQGGIHNGMFEIYYGSKEFKVQGFLFSWMTNDMIRETIVDTSMEAFKKYCLSN